MNKQNLQPNDRVSFDVEGYNQRPYGYARVTRFNIYGDPMLLVDTKCPIPPGAKILNIQKVDSK